LIVAIRLDFYACVVNLNLSKILSQETGRVFLEALEEEMGAAGVPLAPRSREIWTRALAHLNAAQAASFH